MGNKTSKPEAGSDTKNEEDIVQELIKNLENIKNKDIPTVLEKLKKVKGKISSEGESKEGSQEKSGDTPKGDTSKGDTPKGDTSKGDTSPAPSASTTGPPAPRASTTGPPPTPAVESTKAGGTKKRSKKRDTMSDFKRTRSIRLV
mgnify:CR=1 FL=1